MLKKLRWHIILIELGAFLFITVLIVAAINIGFTTQINRNAHQLLSMLEKYGGIIPEVVDSYSENGEDNTQIKIISDNDSATDDEKIQHFDSDFSDLGFGLRFSDETRYTTRYFWVLLDDNNIIIDEDLSHIAAQSVYDVQNYVHAAVKSSSLESHSGKYYYLKVPEEDKTRIYFVDCYSMIESRNSLTRTSIFIASIAMIIATAFVWITSKQVIAPLQKNLELQKRFITDASHELKTPLAAIQVNADVLELTMGENPTIDKIKRQVNNMSGLVEEMLTLSRMDSEAERKEEFSEIDFSSLVEEKVSDFMTRAESQDKKLILNIKPDIKVIGNAKGLERLVSVLCDNAVKYCSSGGEIDVCLDSTLSYAKLEVANTSEKLSQDDMKHLFDRFYRTDFSRSKETGGYGIGLSIAKTVVDQHRGKISAANREDKVCFTVELPIKRQIKKSEKSN